MRKMTLDELKARLDRLDGQLDKIEVRIADLMASVVVLQRANLRLLGAGSLLGSIAIYVLARAVGA